MNQYTLKEVLGKELEKAFLRMPLPIYKDDKAWVRPLDSDIEEVFDPKRNKRLRKGEVIRWILEDGSGAIVGRIAAFVDPVAFTKGDPPVGGVGFFECINSQEAANMLFGAAKQWLHAKGMEGVDGPVNFGDRDRWWGCLKEGFMEPTYCMNYNPAYYNELFEGFGFQNYFNQYTYSRTISVEGVADTLIERGTRLEANPSYQFRHADLKQLDKLALDFNIVFNKAWGTYVGAGDMTLANTKALLMSMKPILDEKLLYFAYHEGEPIGFFIMIPDINQIARQLNGRFDWWGKLKFMYYLKVRRIAQRAVGIIFGVVPEFQGKGVDAGMIMEFARISTSKGFTYNDIEFNWVGDFNPVMMRLMTQIGCSVRKRHITYRMWFDPNRPFTRCPKFGREKKTQA